MLLASDISRLSWDLDEQHTSLLLHIPTLESLIQQTNTQSHINAHPLLVDLTSNPILDQYVGRIGTQLVATVGNLRNDLGVPLALCLTGGDKATHNEIINLSPVPTRACSNVGNDIGI